MTRFRLEALMIILLLGAVAPGRGEDGPLAQRAWFESRTLHFQTYSCGPAQEVARLAARLEQFQEAYSVLAGAQAVASPPIVVMAFPDCEAMQPFLPLYNGKPASLAAFFMRGSDENLIVLYLSGPDAPGSSLQHVFHEYTHLLLRHNQRFWPMWLNEGMAEVYSTFEVAGNYTARIGRPMDYHLRLLAATPLMPLHQLFGVTAGSPEYNESQHQGIFYAESWLLTHYLMVGASPARKVQFGQLTTLLRQGQTAEQAFTNAFQTTLPAMEQELRTYLQREELDSLTLSVGTDLTAPQAMTTRRLTPVEVLFRLGDELFRIRRLEPAEAYFTQAKKLAPASPLPYEGLGLMAADRQEPEEATRYLEQALRLGSGSFLAHYVYSREKYQLTAHAQDRYSKLEPKPATEVRSELIKALTLMPNFGPAHDLLGFFELVQGENLGAAEQHLQMAIRLEPENEGYLLSLAQVQLARQDNIAARRTLDSLRPPYVESHIRAHAEELLRVLDRQEAHR
jgi:tetratricopeptide (TPR) repeat protein